MGELYNSALQKFNAKYGINRDIYDHYKDYTAVNTIEENLFDYNDEIKPIIKKTLIYPRFTLSWLLI